jgi:hypothetical protein
MDLRHLRDESPSGRADDRPTWTIEERTMRVSNIRVAVPLAAAALFLGSTAAFASTLAQPDPLLPSQDDILVLPSSSRSAAADDADEAPGASETASPEATETEAPETESPEPEATRSEAPEPTRTPKASHTAHADDDAEEAQSHASDDSDDEDDDEHAGSGSHHDDDSDDDEDHESDHDDD